MAATQKIKLQALRTAPDQRLQRYSPTSTGCWGTVAPGAAKTIGAAVPVLAMAFEAPTKEAHIMGEIVTVNFRGDELYGFKQDDGTFLALKPMVEAMGLDWSAQFRRVQRDPILAEGIAMMATPFGQSGGQDCLCIKLELVNGWLFTIDSSRIKDEAVRQKVQTYQRECYQVLHDHFAGKRRPVEIEGEPDDAPSQSERRSLVAEARQTFGTQSARELWFQQKLPIVPSMLNHGQNDLYPWTMIRHGDLDASAA